MDKNLKFLLLVYSTLKKLNNVAGLDGNVYSTQVQDTSSSSSFEPVLSLNCLAALELGAGVEQPIDCLIIHNRQAVQS